MYRNIGDYQEPSRPFLFSHLPRQFVREQCTKPPNCGRTLLRLELFSIRTTCILVLAFPNGSWSSKSLLSTIPGRSFVHSSLPGTLAHSFVKVASGIDPFNSYRHTGSISAIRTLCNCSHALFLLLMNLYLDLFSLLTSPSQEQGCSWMGQNTQVSKNWYVRLRYEVTAW